MPVGFYFLENVLDLAVWTDDERGTGDTLHLLAVHVLFYQDPVGDDDVMETNALSKRKKLSVSRTLYYFSTIYKIKKYNNI